MAVVGVTESLPWRLGPDMGAVFGVSGGESTLHSHIDIF